MKTFIRGIVSIRRKTTNIKFLPVLLFGISRDLNDVVFLISTHPKPSYLRQFCFYLTFYLLVVVKKLSPTFYLAGPWTTIFIWIYGKCIIASFIIFTLWQITSARLKMMKELCTFFVFVTAFLPINSINYFIVIKLVLISTPDNITFCVFRSCMIYGKLQMANVIKFLSCKTNINRSPIWVYMM